MHFYRPGREVRKIIVERILLLARKVKEKRNKFSKNNFQDRTAEDKNFIMCSFRYAMSISSSRTHIFLSLEHITSFCLFSCFMLRLKQLREQHNIIRYVLKILTKTQKKTLPELDALL
jgi:hypothetical protein